ncbi:MAG TPA: hypothetical protein VHA30_01695 [Patescibacteria group bacterium]|nr:hypothetical protein [Patescibacteria group bacterium]
MEEEDNRLGILTSRFCEVKNAYRRALIAGNAGTNNCGELKAAYNQAKTELQEHLEQAMQPRKVGHVVVKHPGEAIGWIRGFIAEQSGDIQALELAQGREQPSQNCGPAPSFA